MTDVDLDFVAHQNERILIELHSMRDEVGGMRDEIRALTLPARGKRVGCRHSSGLVFAR